MRLLCLARRRPGGKAVIDWGAVAMAVDDLPLAVLATVDVGDPHGVRPLRDVVAGVCGVFQADRVARSPLTPAARRSKLWVVQSENREASQWKVWLTSSQPLLLTPDAPNTVTESWADDIASCGPGSPLWNASTATS